MARSTGSALLLFVAFQSIRSGIGAPSITLGDIGDANVNSPRFYMTTITTNDKDNKCTYVVKVYGKGVKDHFDLKCDKNNNNNIFKGSTSISNEDYAVFKDSNQDLALFTDTPSTLIVFNGHTCAKRTYTTSKSGTTFKESPMTLTECDKQSKKSEEAAEDWSRRFEEDMKKKYPPCFPFCDEKKPVDVKPSQSKTKPSSGSEDGGDDEVDEGNEDDDEVDEDSDDDDDYKITETDKTSPEYWKQWEKKFDADMKKAFPPCFPFCDKKKSKTSSSSNPSKPHKKPKKTPPQKKDSVEDEDIDEWNF